MPVIKIENSFWVLLFKTEFDAHKYEGYQAFFEKSFCTQEGIYFPAHYNTDTKDTMRVKVLRNYFQGQVNKKGPCRVCDEQDKVDAQRRGGK